MSEFFSPPVKSRQKVANVTTHSAMLTSKKNSIAKQVNVKSVLSSLETPPPDVESIVKSKKFSLVPFAKEQSSVKESSNLQRVDEDLEKDKPASEADNDDDDEDDYEDDNDFEPFETSKKDFYNVESMESKTHRTESEAKSAEVPERQTPEQ